MPEPDKREESDYIDLPPKPSCLVESLRDIGYSMPTAIADLIDNSITSESREISIRFAWNDGNPWIAICDNGKGMSRDELIQAMRLGSQSPLMERSKSDLGRFGLGMKTASFSQCRRLTVVSKASNQHAYGCEWDLDDLEKSGNDSWKLRIFSVTNAHGDALISELFGDHLGKRLSGTLVIWRHLDRIAQEESSHIREAVFEARIDDVRKHLQSVYHRLLTSSARHRKVLIAINNAALEPVDPFFEKHAATQELPEQVIHIDGSQITVRPYILPHHSKTTKEEWEIHAGPGGYLHNQGFYVYRNLRLIISGTWFRLLKKQELTKLVRIRVDIPNSLDHMWEIDVKKSHASPPESVRRELRRIIERIEVRGKRVYQQRGVVLLERARQPAWHRIAKGGGIHYEINRKHPLLVRILSVCDSTTGTLIRDLLSVLESTFPKDSLYADMANSPEELVTPRVARDEFEAMLFRFIDILVSDGKLNSSQLAQLLDIEPFASQRELTELILQEEKMHDAT